MSNKISRNLLIAEAILIALPVSVMAILATIMNMNQAGRLISFDFIDAQAILSVLSLAAIGSGWCLFIAYLRGGIDALKQQHLVWWVILLIGVVILLIALVSNIAPPSAKYSYWWSFRLSFNLFAYASPILIPLVHLAFERFLRKQKPTNSSTASG